MIPMRDGVRLQTALLTPKNPTGPLPFLIDRTEGALDYGAGAEHVVPGL
jgi:predicted acyl esterase